jgi:putative hydrolase of the HAD superfamily
VWRNDGSVDAVVLDVGGVLLLPDPAAFRAHLAPFGVFPTDEQCAHAHYVGMAALDDLGHADFTHANRAIVQFMGVAEEHHDEATVAVGTVYETAFVPIAGCGEQLRRLRAAGLALAVVSNGTGAVETKLAGHGICAVRGAAELPDVAVVVDSGRVGIEKPDPAIFALALKVLDVDPRRCIYVGDSVHFDVNGALAAGLLPVHLTGAAGCAGGHPHFRTLGAFVESFLGE